MFVLFDPGGDGASSVPARATLRGHRHGAIGHIVILSPISVAHISHAKMPCGAQHLHTEPDTHPHIAGIRTNPTQFRAKAQCCCAGHLRGRGECMTVMSSSSNQSKGSISMEMRCNAARFNRSVAVLA